MKKLQPGYAVVHREALRLKGPPMLGVVEALLHKGQARVRWNSGSIQTLPVSTLRQPSITP